jgi:hypothetical protein
MFSMESIKDQDLSELITYKQPWNSVQISLFFPVCGSHTEAGRETAFRFERSVENKITQALSAKSRGLARRCFLEGEAFPSQSNASGSKRFDSALGVHLKNYKIRKFLSNDM